MAEKQRVSAKPTRPSALPQASVQETSKSLRDLDLKQSQDVVDSWEDDEDEDEEGSSELLPTVVIYQEGEEDGEEAADANQVITSASSSTQPVPPGVSRRKAVEPLFAPDGTPLSPEVPDGIAPPPNTPNFRAGTTNTPIPEIEAERVKARPEKTNAPAARMIASALGVRAPKRTEEQKAYDAAARKTELKRREHQKERARKEEMEKQKAKEDMWDG